MFLTKKFYQILDSFKKIHLQFVRGHNNNIYYKLYYTHRIVVKIGK